MKGSIQGEIIYANDKMDLKEIMVWIGKRSAIRRFRFIALKDKDLKESYVILEP